MNHIIIYYFDNQLYFKVNGLKSNFAFDGILRKYENLFKDKKLFKISDLEKEILEYNNSLEIKEIDKIKTIKKLKTSIKVIDDFIERNKELKLDKNLKPYFSHLKIIKIKYEEYLKNLTYDVVYYFDKISYDFDYIFKMIKGD